MLLMPLVMPAVPTVSDAIRQGVRTAKPHEHVFQSCWAAMPGRRPGDTGKVVPRASFDDIAEWVAREQRRRPLKDLSGHVKHPIGALPLRILAHGHGVVGPTVITVSQGTPEENQTQPDQDPSQHEHPRCCPQKASTAS